MTKYAEGIIRVNGKPIQMSETIQPGDTTIDANGWVVKLRGDKSKAYKPVYNNGEDTGSLLEQSGKKALQAIKDARYFHTLGQQQGLTLKENGGNMNYATYLLQGDTIDLEVSDEEQIAQDEEQEKKLLTLFKQNPEEYIKNMSEGEDPTGIVQFLIEKAKKYDDEEALKFLAPLAEKLNISSFKCGGKVRAKVKAKKACNGSKLEDGGKVAKDKCGNKVKKGAVGVQLPKNAYGWTKSFSNSSTTIFARGGKLCPCKFLRQGGKIITVDSCTGLPIHKEGGRMIPKGDDGLHIYKGNGLTGGIGTNIRNTVVSRFNGMDSGWGNLTYDPNTDTIITTIDGHVYHIKRDGTMYDQSAPNNVYNVEDAENYAYNTIGDKLNKLWQSHSASTSQPVTNSGVIAAWDKKHNTISGLSLINGGYNITQDNNGNFAVRDKNGRVYYDNGRVYDSNTQRMGTYNSNGWIGNGANSLKFTNANWAITWDPEKTTANSTETDTSNTEANLTSWRNNFGAGKQGKYNGYTYDQGKAMQDEMRRAVATGWTPSADWGKDDGMFGRRTQAAWNEYQTWKGQQLAKNQQINQEVEAIKALPISPLYTTGGTTGVPTVNETVGKLFATASDQSNTALGNLTAALALYLPKDKYNQWLLQNSAKNLSTVAAKNGGIISYKTYIQ